ncbi:fungal specific transcription factor [Aspergillus sclerotialis]|uniref:Fungal specific transcription factor n=1 Tax=Aspergillus sclerotialis TaxID=2070753 RepID=A0A3A3ACV7_9EURO|nr:fungal specific transcription factor [Aspergillus sclerotialis]
MASLWIRGTRLPSHLGAWWTATMRALLAGGTIAGRRLLNSELESPSISTLQCHLFSVIYLCNASFQNMAHTTLALAVRTAHILGLHLEPPEDMPRTQRELRKRIWWTLYTVESKTCMKLGRPWSASDTISTCQLPLDDSELALQSGSNIASYGDNVTWLTYTVLNTKLVLAAQETHVAFYHKYAEVLDANYGQNLYTDPQSLETCAKFLALHMDSLQRWLRDVPQAMKTKRQDAGEPFSTDHSALDVERYSPLWLQRQRLILELLYHNLSMNLYRPFICFPSPAAQPSPISSTPTVEAHALSCVNHAISITYILRQILMSTDILSGWYEAYQWQWNATLSIVGFILAYPAHPFTPSARSAIDSAITVFEAFGNNFAVAASAANVTRDLTAKADFLSRRLTGTATGESLFLDGVDGFLQDDGGYNLANPIMSRMNEGPTMFQNTLAGAMGLADNGDSLYSFEPLYAGSRYLADLWGFSQVDPE